MNLNKLISLTLAYALFISAICMVGSSQDDDYVTHSELRAVTEYLEGEIDVLETEINNITEGLSLDDIKHGLMEDYDFEEWVRTNIPEEYTNPTISLSVDNTEIYRGQMMEITTNVVNRNDIRSTLMLTLEIRIPGNEAYDLINAPPKWVSPNSYDNQDRSEVKWTNLKPFSDVMSMGELSMRVRVDDPYVTDPYYSNVVGLNLIDNDPRIISKELECVGSEDDSATHRQNTKFKLEVADDDGDDLEVTLCITENGTDLERNFTEYVPVRNGATSEVIFSNRDYGIFKEEDAGKNFTHIYMVSDGLKTVDTGELNGPTIKKPPQIWTGNYRRGLEDEDVNYFWWGKYNFSMKVENPDVTDLKVRLQVSKPGIKPRNDTDWRTLGEKSVEPEEDKMQNVYFVIDEPFNPEYCGTNFYYRFTYTAPDQHGNEFSNTTKGYLIDDRVIRSDVESWTAIFNILLIVLMSLLGGFVIERGSYR